MSSPASSTARAAHRPVSWGGLPSAARRMRATSAPGARGSGAGRAGYVTAHPARPARSARAAAGWGTGRHAVTPQTATGAISSRDRRGVPDASRIGTRRRGHGWVTRAAGVLGGAGPSGADARQAAERHTAPGRHGGLAARAAPRTRPAAASPAQSRRARAVERAPSVRITLQSGRTRRHRRASRAQHSPAARVLGERGDGRHADFSSRLASGGLAIAQRLPPRRPRALHARTPRCGSHLLRPVRSSGGEPRSGHRASRVRARGVGRPGARAERARK